MQVKRVHKAGEGHPWYRFHKQIIVTPWLVQQGRIEFVQLNSLAEFHGLTKTQFIIIAVDRLARDLDTGSMEAGRAIRRPKTVARIMSQDGLGQGG